MSYCIAIDDEEEYNSCNRLYSASKTLSLTCDFVRIVATLTLFVLLLYRKVFSELPFLAKVTVIAYVI